MIRDVRDLITLQFQLEAELAAPPSASGGQLAAIADGGMADDDCALYRRTQTANNRAIRYAESVSMMRDLTEEEVRVCRLRYWWVVEHEHYERTVRAADLYDAEVGEYEPVRMPATRAGEYMVTMRVEDAEGRPVEGMALVAGRRAALTPFEVIGGYIGKSERQVREILRRANAKVRERIDAARAEGDR